MSAKIRVVLFDVMDTLVVDPFFAGIESFFGCDRQSLLRGLAPGVWPRFETGELSADQFYAAMFHDGRSVDGAALEAFLRSRYRMIDGVLPLVEALAHREVPLAALSNYPVWWRMVAEVTPLGALLDWSHVSCETGVRKPDPQAYLGACARLGAAPSEALLVDDREENCRAARDHGLHAHRFTDAASLDAALRDLGLLAAGPGLRREPGSRR